MPKYLSAFVVLFASVIFGCGHRDSGPSASTGDPQVTRVITGSAKHPDPIFRAIEKLEGEGEVRLISVMESFPARYEVRGLRSVLDAVDAMPRKPLAP